MEFTTITEVLKNIRKKKISVEELNKIFIQRIKDSQNLNAFIYFDENIVNEQSRKIDNINSIGPYDGLCLNSIRKNDNYDLVIATPALEFTNNHNRYVVGEKSSPMTGLLLRDDANYPTIRAGQEIRIMLKDYQLEWDHERNINYFDTLSFTDDFVLTGNMTASGDISGSASSTGSFGTIRVGTNTGTLTGGIAFGDGDTGFFESGDDSFKLTIGGTKYWNFI